MSIEVKIDSQPNACNICFTCSDEISFIADLGVIFRILLKDSLIEVTEVYLETLKACDNCSMALRNISNVRDALINTIALDNTKKEAIEYDDQLKEEVDALLCSICCTYSQEVSLSDLAETIEMLIQDSSVELTENALRVMMCCVNCHTNLENISQFQSAIVEEHLKMLSSVDEEEDDISMLSSSQIKDEEVSDYQDSSSYSPGEEDLDSEATSTADVEYTPRRKHQKGGETHDKELKRKRAMSKETYCHDCNLKFKTPKYLRCHLKYNRKHAVKTQQCDLCPKRFFRVHELKDHINFDHLGIKPYSCSICNKPFRHNYDLTRHMKRKHSEKSSSKDDSISQVESSGSYQCEDCGISFSKQCTYKSHRLKFHGAGNEFAYCVQCNKHFDSQEKLKNHIMYSMQHGDKRFKCSQCDRSFHFKRLLEGHISYTHENKGHQCPICKKVFPPPYALSKHLRNVHYLPSVCPKVCKICNKSVKSSMTKHEKTKGHLDKLTHNIDEP